VKMNWRVLAVCGGLFVASPGVWSQTDASVGQHQITDCMTQMDPASKKEDAQEICRQKLKTGIAIGKAKKKKEPKEKPVEAVKPADAAKPVEAAKPVDSPKPVEAARPADAVKPAEAAPPK